MTKPNNAQGHGEKSLVREILKLSGDIFLAIKLHIPPEWLTSDMSIAQLRVLLVLYTDGPNRMSTIASSIGTTLPTVTGTVDLLVKKNMVVRGDDPEDRRLVICTLTSHGQDIINRVWTLSGKQMEKLLYGLSQEELKKAHEVAQILLRNAKSKVA
jgi:DNA-binding MarR family transcriptional regulator